jgi:hypothetical protein
MSALDDERAGDVGRTEHIGGGIRNTFVLFNSRDVNSLPDFKLIYTFFVFKYKMF